MAYIYLPQPRLPKHCVMCILKTWLNAWTTSHRMHEQIRLKCIFGCPKSLDILDHYVCCGRLWRAVSYATRHIPPESIPMRLGVQGTTRENLLNIVVAFTTYHAIKVTDLSLSKSSLNETSRNIEPLAQATKAHARAAARLFFPSSAASPLASSTTGLGAPA